MTFLPVNLISLCHVFSICTRSELVFYNQRKSLPYGEEHLMLNAEDTILDWRPMWVIWPHAHSIESSALCGELQKILDADQKYLVNHHACVNVDRFTMETRVRSKVLLGNAHKSCVFPSCLLKAFLLCYIKWYHITLKCVHWCTVYYQFMRLIIYSILYVLISTAINNNNNNNNTSSNNNNNINNKQLIMSEDTHWTNGEGV